MSGSTIHTIHCAHVYVYFYVRVTATRVRSQQYAALVARPGFLGLGPLRPGKMSRKVIWSRCNVARCCIALLELAILFGFTQTTCGALTGTVQ